MPLSRRVFLGGLSATAIAAATCGLAPMAVAAAPPLTVKVMSVNLMLASKTANQVDGSDSNNAVPDADVAWPARATEHARWILAENPDVVGAQENYSYKDKPQIEVLAPKLPGYKVLHGTTTNPILVRSTFAVQATGTFAINTKGKDGSRFDRYVTWARLTDPRSQRTFYAFNTHTHPYQEDYAARARSVSYDALVAGMKKVDPDLATPFTLTGDFNARSDETQKVYRDHLVKLPAAGIYPMHTRPGVKDASAVPASSYNGYGIVLDGRWRYHAIRDYGYRTPEKKHVGYLYDYVWVGKGATVSEYEVVTGPGVRWFKSVQNWFFADLPIPSDHNPVTAVVTYP